MHLIFTKCLAWEKQKLILILVKDFIKKLLIVEKMLFLASKIYFKLYLKNKDIEDVIKAVWTPKKKTILSYLLQHNESKNCFLVLCIDSQRREE